MRKHQRLQLKTGRKGGMKMKNILTAVAGFMIGVSFNVNAQSQPSAPPDKHKAGQETLAKRYSRYACAVVHLSNELGSGTGFFVDDKGTVATAAHVIYQNEYGGTQQAPRITLHHPATGVQVITSDNQTFSYTYPAELEQADYTRATADLALMKTGHSSKCYLPLSKRTTESVGEHIIAIGFPGFADNQVLYEGFLSSTGKALPFPVGQIGGQPVYPQYRLLRVQMPITPGASGGPLIDDEGKVLGVISQEPVV